MLLWRGTLKGEERVMTFWMKQFVEAVNKLNLRELDRTELSVMSAAVLNLVDDCAGEIRRRKKEKRRGGK